LGLAGAGKSRHPGNAWWLRVETEGGSLTSAKTIAGDEASTAGGHIHAGM